MSNATMFDTSTMGIWIEPLDPLFFRDGRPFGAADRGASGLPTPQTLHGMIKGHLVRSLNINPRDLHDLRDNGKHPHQWVSKVAVRGPWFARRSTTRLEDVYVPAPAHLVSLGKAGKEYRLLRPLRTDAELPGWNVKNPCGQNGNLAPLWAGECDEDIKPSREYVGREGLAQLLHGDLPTEDHLYRESDFFEHEDRVGVAINPDSQTASDGQLYSVSYLRLRDSIPCRNGDKQGKRCERGTIGFYAEIGAIDDDTKTAQKIREHFAGHTVLPFGGEGRRVVIEPIEQHKWPKCSGVPAPDDGGYFSWLITPVGWDAGKKSASNGKPMETRWAPPHPLGQLVAAAVSGTQAVSGWNLSGNVHEKEIDDSHPGANIHSFPRPNRHLLQAGSVYFWRRGANTRNENGLPTQWQLAQTPADAQAGWGVALRGSWKWWGS